MFVFEEKNEAILGTNEVPVVRVSASGQQVCCERKRSVRTELRLQRLLVVLQDFVTCVRWSRFGRASSITNSTIVVKLIGASLVGSEAYGLHF